MGEVKVMAQVTPYCKWWNQNLSLLSCHCLLPKLPQYLLEIHLPVGGRQPSNQFLVISGATEVQETIFPLDFLLALL